MKTKALAGALVGSFLLSSALTPLRAADVTNERLLNPQREPQNWILHHGNYQGPRFSLLKEINIDTVKNLKLAYTVALGGYQDGCLWPRQTFSPRNSRVRTETGSNVGRDRFES
jgi:alcohol dehydrogenase (cytochrome c)